jgi:hypothetical protein
MKIILKFLAIAIGLSLPAAGQTTLFTNANVTTLLTLSSTSGTSAGGLKFGTDVNFYRRVSGALNLNHIAGGNPAYELAENGTRTASFETSIGDVYLTARDATKSIIFRTGAIAAALTLDSSQNANAAGNVYVSGSGKRLVVGGSAVSTTADFFWTAAFGADLQSFGGLPLYLNRQGNATIIGGGGGGATISVGATTSALTDLLINPTTKASGNLFLGQVNSVDKFKVDYAGNVTAAGGLVAGGSLDLGTSSYVGWNARTYLFANGNGTLRFSNNALTAGGTIDAATDATFKFRDTANSADAAITAGTGSFSGAVSIGNTVNSVSPTSPNRTVTIVINGTTYYLAAKTTND